jgi:hypothetical protein
LFGGYVLENVQNLCHVDYAAQIYTGRLPVNISLPFESRGYIYGPIRLSASPHNPVYRALVQPTTAPDFICDKTAIFFVRDPRDILVSAYYSFGFTHGLSPVREIREMQERKRGKIQQQSLDQYVLQHAATQAENFRTLYRLSQHCKRGIILKYEDMINDFDKFINYDGRVSEVLSWENESQQKRI